MPVARPHQRWGVPYSQPPAARTAPAIAAAALVGSARTYTAGVWIGNPIPTVTRQWLLDGNPIGGETNATYTPVAGDEGSARLSVRETAQSAAGTTTSTSDVVSINRVPAFTAAPVILGVPTVGTPVSYNAGALVGFPTPTVTRQWLLDGNAISGATAATYTPVSGDAGAGRLSVRETATNAVGSASSTSAAVDVVSGTAATTITTVSLTSTAATGVQPFAFAVGIGSGEATSIATDLATNEYQVTVLRRWMNGSAKHVLVSGFTSLTQNVAKTIAITNGTAPTGTALTAADIQAAAPTATVQCGSFGTVSLSSLLASPVRTPISGPRMVEVHYRADVGGGTLLSVWFHVRLFSNGRVWIRAIVENGYLDNGAGAVAPNTDQSYVPTVTINGVSVYTNGGATLLHCKNTRWMADGWVGTSPSITPTYDVAYLRSTKLVPNYGWRSPSASALDALAQTYTPMGSGNQPTAISGPMHTGGNNPWHGLLPDWDAMFCGTGDARAYRAVLNNSSALNSFTIVLRRRASGGLAGAEGIACPSDFPTWTAHFVGVNVGGPGGQGIKEVYTSASPQLEWEYHHNPHTGYLAYILTGDYWHLETLAFQCANKFFWTNSTNGSGLARRMTHSETRGTWWAMRDVGSYAAIAPTGDAVAADYRTWLQNSIEFFCAEGPENPALVAPGIGFPMTWSNHDPAQGPLRFASWQMKYGVSVLGFLWDLEPGFASTTKHQTLRNFLYSAVVGEVGTTGTSNFGFTRSGEDSLQISSVAVPHFAYRNVSLPYYANWGLVWQNSFPGVPNTGAVDGAAFIGTAGPGGSIDCNGRFAMNLPALAYAVDHGATGAQAAYNRFVGASNYPTLRDSGFDNNPRMGIKPRNTNAPAYVRDAALNTWTDLPNSETATVQSQFTQGIDPLNGSPYGLDGIFAWCGYTLGGPNYDILYLVWGGGHTDQSDNGTYAYNLRAENPGWSVITTPSDPSQRVAAQRYYNDNKPISRHNYWEPWYFPDNRLLSLGIGSWWSPNGGAVPYVDGIQCASNGLSGTLIPPGHGIPNVPTGAYNPDIPHCQDENTFNVYVHTKDGGTLQRFNWATNTWTGFSAITTSGIGALSHNSNNNKLYHFGPFPRVYDAPSGSNTNAALSFTGANASIGTTNGASVEFVKELNLFLIRPFGQDTIYQGVVQADPNVVSITTYSVAGTPPTRIPGGASATYRRFVYVKSLGIVVCHGGGANQKAKFFKVRNI